MEGAKEQADVRTEAEKRADALIDEFLSHPTYAPIFRDGIHDAERATLKTFIHFLMSKRAR